MSRPTGFKHTEETKMKMRIANRDRYNRGNNNPRWVGGEVEQRKYVYIWKPEHPGCNSGGYIRKHRVIMEEFLGRHLTPEEIVHHKNKDTSDNRIENLELFKNHSEHIKQHHNERKNNG